MAIRASKQIDSSVCKNDFWNFEVFSRGGIRFYFYDNSRRIITTLSDSIFSVDSIVYHKNDFVPFTGLQEMEVEQMSKIAHCFKEMNIRKIRGFDTDSLRYLECIINDDLILYYIPEIQNITRSKRSWLIENTNQINENYFYYIHRSRSIWRKFRQ